MGLLRATLRLTAPLGSELIGPTLFGRLCWLVAEGEGADALARFLDPAAMWRLSDAFPHGFLPRPLTAPRPLGARDPTALKKLKKRALVRRETWLARRAAWDETALDPDRDLADAPRLEQRRAHNVVDRRGRGTLETGGLFFLTEDWRCAREETARLDLYIETGDAPECVRRRLADLGAEGFGRDASTGRGRWTVEAVAPDPELAEGPRAGRRMSLSRGALDASTMREALWKLAPHFGKAGPQVTASGASPFKKPALLTQPGLTFRAEGPGPWGRWVTGAHPARPEIGLNAFHVTIPFAEAPP
jgi:CRISPR-associated protein Csm4